MEYATLNNGVKMPMAGIGTFLLTPDEAEASCVSALRNGYRLIDTANAYVNEKAVGRAMKKSGLQREEIFLETKLWPSFYEQPDAVDKTLARLDTPYIDLLLIHQPAGNYVAGYGVTKLDGIVEKVIRMKFAEIAAAPESEILNHQHKKEIELARIKLDQANAHLAEKQKDLSDYKAETLKVIRGQSSLSVELLNALVKETETMIALAQTRIDAAQAEYESLLASAENLRQEYDRLLTWADLFDTCSFEAKKMIVAQFLKAVRVSRDYNIEIDFNVSFEEFQNFSVKNGEPVILQPLRSHTA